MPSCTYKGTKTRFHFNSFNHSAIFTVGTSGLGYPLLLCLGKSLVVILDYIRTAGPLRTGALFT